MFSLSNLIIKPPINVFFYKKYKAQKMFSFILLKHEINISRFLVFTTLPYLVSAGKYDFE